MAHIFSANDFAIRGHICPPRLSRVLVNLNAQVLDSYCNKAYAQVDQCILGDNGDTSRDETGKSHFLGSLSGTCNLRSHVK